MKVTTFLVLVLVGIATISTSARPIRGVKDAVAEPVDRELKGKKTKSPKGPKSSKAPKKTKSPKESKSPKKTKSPKSTKGPKSSKGKKRG